MNILATLNEVSISERELFIGILEDNKELVFVSDKDLYDDDLYLKISFPICASIMYAVFFLFKFAICHKRLSP